MSPQKSRLKQNRAGCTQGGRGRRRCRPQAVGAAGQKLLRKPEEELRAEPCPLPPGRGRTSRRAGLWVCHAQRSVGVTVSTARSGGVFRAPLPVGEATIRKEKDLQTPYSNTWHVQTTLPRPTSSSWGPVTAPPRPAGTVVSEVLPAEGAAEHRRRTSLPFRSSPIHVEHRGPHATRPLPPFPGTAVGGFPVGVTRAPPVASQEVPLACQPAV